MVNKVFELIKQRQFDHALSFLLENERKSTLSWHQLYLIGFCFRQRGDIPESIIYYKKSLDISPEQSLTLNALGISYQKLKLFEEAELRFQQSIQILKNAETTSVTYRFRLLLLLSDALNSLGVNQQLQSEYQGLCKHLATRSLNSHLEAVRVIEQAITLKVNCELLRQNLPACRFTSVKTKLEFAYWYDVTEASVFLVNTATQFLNLKKFKEAEQILHKALFYIDEEHACWVSANNLKFEILDSENSASRIRK